MLKKLVVAGLCLLGLMAASRMFESAGPARPSDQTHFSNTFEADLGKAGLSAEHARFLAFEGHARSMASIIGKNLGFGESREPWLDNAVGTMESAVRAVGNDTQFPDTDARHAALGAIAQAHISALSEHVLNAKEASRLLRHSTRASLAAFDQSGLAGDEVQEAFSRTGKGAVAGLMQSQYSDAKLDDLAKAFAQGAAEGLVTHPGFRNSGAELTAALTEGAFGELTKASELYEDDKGVLIREFVRGLHLGLTEEKALPEAEVAHLLSAAAAAGQLALMGGNPELTGMLLAEISDIKNSVPGIVVFPMNGTPVGDAVECSCGFDGGDGAAPVAAVHSINQCLSYCDEVANNRPGDEITAFVNGEPERIYSLPRASLGANEAVGCVARITTSAGSMDYRSEDIMDGFACMEFCNELDSHGGHKTCMAVNQVLIDYDSTNTSKALVAAPDLEPYDTAHSSGTRPGSSCEPLHEPLMVSACEARQPGLKSLLLSRSSELVKVKSGPAL